MDKKLPNIYANPIPKKVCNVQEYYYGPSDIRSTSVDEKDVRQKIDEIFRSRSFVYKSQVSIITSVGSMERVLVGKNQNSLLTMEGDVIPISSIIDIQKK
ncbi:MAG: hypothetical protein HFH86_04635 [Bacilli bacterium]|jgi:hypothetical protein|nr:hypothetical protein [Bacilli bacterium]